MLVDARRQIFGDLNELTDIVTRNDKKKENGAISYSVFSKLPDEQPLHYQQPVRPMIRDAYRRSQYFDRSTRLPNNLKQLRQLSQTIVGDETERIRKAEGRQEARKLTSMEIASALESHLRDSGEYRYSLDLSIDDPAIDPIEDFLFNRKAGHCEYFATALALMLRAEKIPARVVTGYKGGIVNPERKEWLEVQQRFAHAWVEVWVEDVGWTTFDATPIDERSNSIAAMSAKKGSIWTDMQTTLAGLWSENILNMSLDRQEESIYKPMRELALSLLAWFRELIASPQSAMQSFIELLRNRERWFSVGGGLFALALMLAAFGIYRLYLMLLAKLRSWLGNSSNRRLRQRYRIVEFYDRFVSLMTKHGLERSPTQTQREFAELVSMKYSSELQAAGVTDLPTQISQLFYQVRFGEEELSEADARHMEDLLTNLSLALISQSNTANGHKTPSSTTQQI